MDVERCSAFIRNNDHSWQGDTWIPFLPRGQSSARTELAETSSWRGAGGFMTLPHTRRDTFAHRQLALDASSGCGDSPSGRQRTFQRRWMWSQKPRGEGLHICWRCYSGGLGFPIYNMSEQCLHGVSRVCGSRGCKDLPSCLARLSPALPSFVCCLQFICEYQSFLFRQE